MSTLTRACSQWRLLVIVGLAVVLCGALPVTAQISDREAITALETTQAGFRLVQKKVAPSVVTIYSTTRASASSAEVSPFDLFGFGAPRPSQTRRVSGSGVIIRADGTVLTNSHVVQDATSVTVQLPGSDKRLPAKVIQSDPRTDLAVIRITENRTYPTAVLGDANTVQVGDWAIAFGSPYGLPSTMTVGVISATGRRLEGPVGDFNYYNLIQTDASINHGNSGGPLVNIRGEVVGINFMIFSPGEESGSIGIGFAIPVNEFTKKIIETLVSGRAFERGLIGIQIGELDEAKRQEFGVADGGVLVQNVVPGKAGARAGLKDEDVIVEFNGVKITGTDQFINLVQQTTPGTNVTIRVIRNKKPVTMTVTLGTDTPEKTADAGEATALDTEKVGMSVTTITPQLVRQFDLPVTTGVLVTKVQPESPAAAARMVPGTIIVRVGDTEITSAEQFWSVLGKKMAASKFGVVMRVRKGEVAETVTLPRTTDDQ